MQVVSFNAELAIANLMFMRLFSNITISRAGRNGKQSSVKVNCQLGQKSRVFKSWQNDERRAAMKLPMIVINRTGYARSPDRLNSMHNEIKYELTSKYRKYDLLTPVPIDISYDVTVISKWPSDIDQIASNFMVFFNPDVYVTCQHPKYEGIQLNNQVLMSDSVNEEHADEIDGATDDFTSATFQFTFKTYLFGGQQQTKKKGTMLSTWTQTSIKPVVRELTDEDLKNLSAFDGCKLSVTVDQEVTELLSAYVEDPNADAMYDDFVPIAKNIDVGFYPVSSFDGLKQYLQDVDSMDPNWMYVDRVHWIVDERLGSPTYGELVKPEDLSSDLLNVK